MSKSRGSANYEALADILRERITPEGYRDERGGEVSYSERLPSLRELSAELGDPPVIENGEVVREGKPVNHMTMTKALHLLRDEGLLLAVDRQGYFVRRHPRLRYNITRTTTPGVLIAAPIDTWLDDVRAAGLSGRQIITPEPVMASARVDAYYTVAELLEIDPGKIAFSRRRVRYIGMNPAGPANEPESLHDSFYDMELAEAADLMNGESINTARQLTEAGFGPVSFHLEFGARIPSREESTRLKLPRATPLLERISVARTASGRVVWAQHTVTAGNNTRVTLDINDKPEVDE